MATGRMTFSPDTTITNIDRVARVRWRLIGAESNQLNRMRLNRRCRPDTESDFTFSSATGIGTWSMTLRRASCLVRPRVYSRIRVSRCCSSRLPLSSLCMLWCRIEPVANLISARWPRLIAFRERAETGGRERTNDRNRWRSWDGGWVVDSERKTDQADGQKENSLWWTDS